MARQRYPQDDTVPSGVGLALGLVIVLLLILGVAYLILSTPRWHEPPMPPYPTPVPPAVQTAAAAPTQTAVVATQTAAVAATATAVTATQTVDAATQTARATATAASISPSRAGVMNQVRHPVGDSFLPCPWYCVMTTDSALLFYDALACALILLVAAAVVGVSRPRGGRRLLLRRALVAAMLVFGLVSAVYARLQLDYYLQHSAFPTFPPSRGNTGAEPYQPAIVWILVLTAVLVIAVVIQVAISGVLLLRRWGFKRPKQ